MWKETFMPPSQQLFWRIEEYCKNPVRIPRSRFEPGIPQIWSRITNYYTATFSILNEQRMEKFICCNTVICIHIVLVLFVICINIQILCLQWSGRQNIISFACKGRWWWDWRCSSQWDCASMGSGYCCREKPAQVYKNTLLFTTTCNIRC